MMNEKTTKKYSIVARIFLLLMSVIFLQAALSLSAIVMTDIATTVESYSYNSFTRTVTNRKSNIESFMSASWSNISEISSMVSEEYQTRTVDGGELTEDEKVDFLMANVGAIVQMMTMTGTTGGFLILDDGENMTYSYSNVYLKNYDNLSHVVNSENLVLVRGPAEVSKENGFSLASNWSYGVTLTEDTLPILTTPMDASVTTKSLDYLGYWHVSDDLTNNKLKVLTCSMPIFDSDNNAVGVIGIEVTQEYFYKFLPESEFSDKGSYGYILGDISQESSDFFTTTLLNGTNQSNLLSLGEEIILEDLPLGSHELEVEPKLVHLNEIDLCVYYEPLQLYTNNSPYQNQEVWIMGMVDLKNMTTFTDEFWQVIGQMLAVSLTGGVILSLFVGKTVAQPILGLSKAVSAYDVQEKITFNPSKIREIDELSTLIAQMQENILRSAHRTDKILELLNMGVGSFEYEKGNSMVTVSEAVYKMLNLGKYQGIPIPKEIFFERLAGLKEHPIEEVANTYAVGAVQTSYFKVVEFHQEDVILGIIQDTTQEVVDLLVLNYERNYDVLTGIFNRRAFHQKAVEALNTEDMKTAGFVMFDLDNLKYVNDTFGHDSGDVYIKTAATTIHSALHKYGVVGRMSGDEFYAFLYGFDSKEALMEKLNALYSIFEAEPIEMPDAVEFKIRVSGGIAWYGDDSRDLEELKKYADFAMYKGKHTLKGQMRQFNLEMYLEESFMLSGKAELNRILDNELMNFVFQPIIDVKTGNIFGYEALMRPMSEILATPPKLLQLATLEGKLWKVEKIALFKTLSLYKKHRNLFGDAKLFINSIPSENLKDEEYAELNTLYYDCLENIVIEITEQEQQNDGFIESKLEKLHMLKLDIALDDYGSGYANDMGLIKMRPDIVKIDRSLISNVHVDPSRQTIVHKIIAFCKQENITILGEGIETEQELEYLMHAGIELAQGYYISRPMEMPNFDTKDILAKINEVQTQTGFI